MASFYANLPLFGQPRFIFHPIVIYLVGYMLWYFIPPFFFDGHNWHIIFLDQIALFFLVIGVSVAQVITGSLTCEHFNFKIVTVKSYHLWLLSFGVVLYGLRSYQFSQEGIVSVLHAYASKEGLYVSIKGALTLPFLLLVWFGIFVFKLKGNYLLILFELVYAFPSGSKSRFAFVFVSGVLVFVYVYGLSNKRFLQLFFMVPFVLASLVLYSAVTHDLRTASINNKHSGLDMISFYNADYVKSAKHLGARFNLHSTWKLMDGYEALAADLEVKAMNGLFDRLTLQTDDIENGPGITKLLKRAMFGHVDSKSALVWPRNVILYNVYGLGVLAIGIVHIVLGVISGVLYTLLFRKDMYSCLFVFVYIPFAISFLFGADSNITAVLFHVILFFISLSLPLFVFFLLKMLRRILLASLMYSRSGICIQ